MPGARPPAPPRKPRKPTSGEARRPQPNTRKPKAPKPSAPKPKANKPKKGQTDWDKGKASVKNLKNKGKAMKDLEKEM